MIAYYCVGENSQTIFCGAEPQNWDFMVGDDKKIIYSDAGFLRWLDGKDGVAQITAMLEEH